jgi:hypothetical protein
MQGTTRQQAVSASAAVKQYVWSAVRTDQNGEDYDRILQLLEARAAHAMNAYKREIL